MGAGSSMVDTASPRSRNEAYRLNSRSPAAAAAGLPKVSRRTVNDYYDFIFDSEDRQTIVDNETVAERGWDFDEGRTHYD